MRMRPPRPWGLRTAKLSPLSLASGWPSGVTSYADQNETSQALGPASSDTAVIFLGFGGPSGVTISADQNETSSSLGGATCETVVTFVESWGAQRRDVLRGSE